MQKLFEPIKRHMLMKTILPLTAALVLLFTTASSTLADTPHELVKKGNKDVVEKNLDDALEKYIRAQTKLDSTRPELLYNLGGVYARKGEIERADTLFQSLPEGTREDLRARADYNRGTAFAEAQQYEQAVPALIDALKKDPYDEDAKINLELALRRQQKQQQQQNQDQQNQDQKDQQDEQDKQNQDQQDQDQQNQEDQQDQQNQDQQDQQQDQQDQQQQDQQDQEEQENQQQQQMPEDLNEEMAKRLLEQMQQDEKELLKEVVRKQVPAGKSRTKKPW